jgi:hypothetical protein
MACQFTVVGEIVSSSFEKNEIVLKAQEYANNKSDTVTIKVALSEKESSLSPLSLQVSNRVK